MGVSKCLKSVRVWVGCCPGSNVRLELSESDAEQRRLNAHRIACPVLAMMFRAGLLNPTPDGVINWEDLMVCLRNIGFCRASSYLQTMVCAYREGDIEQSVRDRGARRRFLNIYRMSPGETSESAARQVQHGFSTIIRDSREEGDDATDAAAVRLARKAKLDAVFQSAFTTAPGVERRCYLDGLSRVLGHLKVHGDKSGEWSSENVRKCHPKAAAREDGAYLGEMTEWQPLIAFCACWMAFGEVDEHGERYMSEAALEGMYLDSQLPRGWEVGGRSFGLKEIIATVVGLGSETGLLLPGKLQDEILSRGCIPCQLCAAAKFGLFFAKRGILDDLDPPAPPEPKTAADVIAELVGFLVLLALLLRGWGAVFQVGPLEGSSAIWGAAIAVLPTLLLLKALRGVCCNKSKAAEEAARDYHPLERASPIAKAQPQPEPEPEPAPEPAQH